MLSEIFWTTFITTMSGLILAIIAACYKSKCRYIKLGCVEINRDVEGEEKIDTIEHERA
jgi:hypothetical protein